MWKIFLALLLISSSAWAGQWRNGTGEQTILGTSQAGLIGFNAYNSIVQPIDNIESDHCTEYLQYASSTTMTVHSGTCVVSNSGGTIRLFMQDIANTTITSSNLDTGSITASTTYYVYATAATTSTSSSTYYISASNTAPSGQTYYYQIGSFSTDANSQFTGISNNQVSTEYVGIYTSKSYSVIYQALTDMYVGCFSGTGSGCNIYTGSISGSLSAVQACGNLAGMVCAGSWIIRKGDYYEFTGSGSAFALPMSK